MKIRKRRRARMVRTHARACVHASCTARVGATRSNSLGERETRRSRERERERERKRRERGSSGERKRNEAFCYAWQLATARRLVLWALAWDCHVGVIDGPPGTASLMLGERVIKTKMKK